MQQLVKAFSISTEDSINGRRVIIALAPSALILPD